MLPVLLIMYAIYFIMVAINNNATELVTKLETEKQFLYWVMVLLIVTALWESQSGQKIAKPFAVLIVLGFLLKTDKSTGQSNWQTIAANAKQILPGL